MVSEDINKTLPTLYLRVASQHLVRNQKEIYTESRV